MIYTLRRQVRTLPPLHLHRCKLILSAFANFHVVGEILVYAVKTPLFWWLTKSFVPISSNVWWLNIPIFLWFELSKPLPTGVFPEHLWFLAGVRCWQPVHHRAVGSSDRPRNAGPPWSHGGHGTARGTHGCLACRRKQFRVKKRAVVKICCWFPEGFVSEYTIMWYYKIWCSVFFLNHTPGYYPQVGQKYGESGSRDWHFSEIDELSHVIRTEP